MEYEAPIILDPEQSPAKACVIWLHGLGADGHDFEPIVPQLALPEGLGVRFIFPHAPVQPVTINGGYQMRAWYDIREINLQRDIDLQGVAQSVDYLNALVEQQRSQGIGMDKIVLAGFSQGGVIALDCALRMAEKPVGVMALSTYLAEEVGDGKGLNIFQAHGTQDDVVLPAAAEMARDSLTRLGAEVSFHQYPMPHSVHPTEVMDISNWLRARLA